MQLYGILADLRGRASEFPLAKPLDIPGFSIWSTSSLPVDCFFLGIRMQSTIPTPNIFQNPQTRVGISVALSGVRQPRLRVLQTQELRLHLIFKALPSGETAALGLARNQAAEVGCFRLKDIPEAGTQAKPLPRRAAEHVDPASHVTPQVPIPSW